MLLVLGLTDRMVGCTGISGLSKLAGTMRTGLARLPAPSECYPTRGGLVGADLEFRFAGWNCGMTVGGEETRFTAGRHAVPTAMIAAAPGPRSIAAIRLLSATFPRNWPMRGTPGPEAHAPALVAAHGLPGLARPARAGVLGGAAPDFVSARGTLFPFARCGRSSLQDLRQASGFSAASARVGNQCWFRHSLRKRPLKAWMNALSAGFPGHGTSSVTPRRLAR
jgi:hypothetical protein